MTEWLLSKKYWGQAIKIERVYDPGNRAICEKSP